MDKTESIINLFPDRFRGMLSRLDTVTDTLREIRLRVNCPCSFLIGGKELYVKEDGRFCKRREDAVYMDRAGMTEIFNHICRYSPYAFESQLRQGYLTVAGGHRIGIFGQAVMEEQKVALIKYIQFIHIRVVHEVMHAGKPVLPFLFEKGELKNTLVISPPGVGKTTMLRDLARLISDGGGERPGMQVSVIDERSEIAGCYMGVPQTKVGLRTDVLDGCPKAVGMLMAIRAMAPELLVVDELGLAEDYDAVAYAAGCGIRLLASVHGSDLADAEQKYERSGGFLHRYFQRFLVLYRQKGGGHGWELLDEEGRRLAASSVGKEGASCG